jgi:lysyl endopeptidase
MKQIILLLITVIASLLVQAQVRTNYNNNEAITEEGFFAKRYKATANVEIPAKDIRALLEAERQELAKSEGGQPLRIAVPVPVDLNVAKLANWTVDGEYAFGKLDVNLQGALSASINFDQFYLPKGTEMYIYNAKGNMITGPVTEKENNADQIWGSWVYKGGRITIEIKTPEATKDRLVLHAHNVAYGYKPLYETQVGAFGASQTCNINVLCALGNGWENERNAVNLILNGNGSALCSGAMVMNTCNTNRPFVLTANHCFTANTNVASWRFTFQAWSPNCTPNQNSDGVTFNGSALRANSAATDFCLVEMNTTPAANSGIQYAGWSRNTTGITQSTIIHHPRGDVMKITRDNQAPGTSSFGGASCWFLVTDQGTTENGSSGAPYFDQNRRIIGQHFGINDANLPICSQVNKFGGRFDLSWTGGGTNATRLSNWLDPNNTGATTTNTTNIANLLSPTVAINGPSLICNSAVTTYTLTGLPAGATVTWTSSGGGGTLSGSGTTATLTPNGTRATMTITASFTAPAGCPSSVSRTVSINAPVTLSSSINGCSNGFQVWQLSASPTSNGSNWNWSVSFTGTNSQINIQSPSSPSTQVNVKGGGTVRLNYTDACGVARQDGITVFSNCPAFRVAVSPNPANGNIVVSMNPPTEGRAIEDEAAPVSPLRKIASRGQTVLTLFEVNTTRPLRQWKFNETQNPRYNIGLAGLRSGTYLLQVDRDNVTRVTKLMVQ